MKVEQSRSVWVLTPDKPRSLLVNQLLATGMSGFLAFAAVQTIAGSTDWDWPAGIVIGLVCVAWQAHLFRTRPFIASQTTFDRLARQVRIETLDRRSISMSFDEIAGFDLRRSEDHGVHYAQLILKPRSGRKVVVGSLSVKSGDTSRLDALELQVQDIRATTGIPR